MNIPAHNMVTQLFIHSWYSWQVTFTNFMSLSIGGTKVLDQPFLTLQRQWPAPGTCPLCSQKISPSDHSPPKAVIQQSQPRISTFVTAGLQQNNVFPHYTHKEQKDARENSWPISRRSTCTLNYILWSQVSPSGSTYWESQRSLWSNARDPCHHLLEHSLPGPHTYTGRDI